MALTRILLLLWFASVVQSQSLSPCALACIQQTVPAAGCALGNITCQCTSKSLPQLSAACMLANCSMADTLGLSKLEAQTCNLPFQNRSNLVIITFIVAMVVTGTAVLLRLASKILDNKIALEDWIIIVALMLAISANSLAIICMNHLFCDFQRLTLSVAYEGFGKHGYSLQNGDLLAILEHFPVYIAENIYVVALSITKLSILALYLRVFQHQHRFKIAVYALIFVIILSTTILSALTIFQCHPISYFWDKDIHNGACLDVNALAYANSGSSIAQDFMIIALPIPVISKLNMETRRKVAVGFMFAVGGFGCIISIVRLQSLLVFGNSIDPTWDYVPVTIWTALELGSAMICSCMPALRTLFHRIFPRIRFSSSSSRSSASASTLTSVWQSRRVMKQDDGFMELPNIETGTLNIKWGDREQHVEDSANDVRIALNNFQNGASPPDPKRITDS
ncbi:uncharacterized protein LY89DRAFT_747710 [Mollisia scopiformis]|uniref:Uncharacterized protein n=1 Tax=Mollisia scopiformis TaxID=149040 RepID=A0A194XDI2_MOLSC|nr:uncharacterized protein LY89DRAFT_747710 [Mollisia scopiformis]KUJ17812.1 hypothetical protein LY89DRAFT_747710 [Mollisia scopiformis]